MKNILLVGDSIRMGYDKGVKKALEGRANVVCPEENCSFASNVFRYINEWTGDVKCEDIDLVHFNFGLHDCLRAFGEEPNTPLDIYKYYVERTCLRIKKLFPRAKAVFATTTSVVEEKMNPDYIRRNVDIEQYNEAAVEIVKKHGFEVNDLYEFSKSLPMDVRSDAVHFYTDKGRDEFVQKVLLCITNLLDI